MSKTLDGYECHNPLHEAADQAKKQLALLMKRVGIELGHYHKSSCSTKENELYD